MQFRSRLEGASKARRIWTCKGCGLQHSEKPKECKDCRGRTFHFFQSGKEADRYAALALRLCAGLITDLEVHPVFVLHAPRWVPDESDPSIENVEERKVGEYRADFGYRVRKTGERIVEDVKASADAAAIDPLFFWKVRHVEAEYGIRISSFS